MEVQAEKGGLQRRLETAAEELRLVREERDGYRYLCVRVYVVCVCVCVCVSEYKYVCMYVCIYIYIGMTSTTRRADSKMPRTRYFLLKRNGLPRNSPFFSKFPVKMCGFDSKMPRARFKEHI